LVDVGDENIAWSVISIFAFLAFLGVLNVGPFILRLVFGVPISAWDEAWDSGADLPKKKKENWVEQREMYKHLSIYPLYFPFQVPYRNF
jgi:hypothetical protein